MLCSDCLEIFNHCQQRVTFSSCTGRSKLWGLSGLWVSSLRRFIRVKQATCIQIDPFELHTRLSPGGMKEPFLFTCPGHVPPLFSNLQWLHHQKGKSKPLSLASKPLHSLPGLLVLYSFLPLGLRPHCSSSLWSIHLEKSFLSF